MRLQRMRTHALTAFLLVILLSACSTASQVTQPPPPPTSAEQPPSPTALPTAIVTVIPQVITEEPSSQPSGGISFSADVLPILQKSCVNCHGGQRTSANLDLKTYAALMNGSENGAVVIPGDAENSLLVTLPESGKMPKRGAKLTPEQIQILKDWINAGAPNN